MVDSPLYALPVGVSGETRRGIERQIRWDRIKLLRIQAAGHAAIAQ